MAWAIVAGAVAPALVGGLLGGKKTEAAQTQKQELDPRMQGLLYGGNGDNGLLNDVNDLRKKQLLQGGLNPMQRSGMEMQRQTLMSPQFTQGFDQMRSMGSQLMGAGVAGNPFNNGMTLGGGGGGMGGGMPTPMAAQPQAPQQMQPFQYQQNEAMQGAQNPYVQAPQQAAPPAPQQAAAPDMAAMQAYLQEQAYKKYMEDELRGAGA